MGSLYSPIEPYCQGYLPVSALHTLYFEEAGNPEGKPVVFLHGGPGGGIVPLYRQFFNPERWRIVLFDQRGCGRSTPYAELEENTTWDLVGDIEKLRSHAANCSSNQVYPKKSDIWVYRKAILIAKPTFV